jgi:hypothetical protein
MAEVEGGRDEETEEEAHIEYAAAQAWEDRRWSRSNAEATKNHIIRSSQLKVELKIAAPR